MNQNNNLNKINSTGGLDSSNNVRFEGEESQRSDRSSQSETPKIIQWMITYSGGFIKDEKIASYVILAFTTILVIISLFLFPGNEEIDESYIFDPETAEPDINDMTN